MMRAMRHIALWIAPAFALLGMPKLGNAADAEIQINPGQKLQTIDGFGVNFNGTYYRPAQKKLLDLLVNDLGVSIVRLDPYGQSDWEMINDNSDPEAIDWNVFNDRFSIPAFEASWAAGRAFNQRGVRVYLNVSGTIPPWMLSDAARKPVHKVCGHSITTHPFTNRPVYLAKAMYGEFAETVTALAVYARKTAGLKFDLFGPINETDCWPIEGPRVDADEAPALAATVVQHLKRAGLSDLKLVLAENALISNDYITPLLKESEVMQKVGVFAFHNYSTLPTTPMITPLIERIKNSDHPELPLWMTEYGDLTDTDRSAEGEWKNYCVTATHRLLDGLEAGVKAALWWDGFDNYHDHDKRMTYYALVANDNHVYTPKKRFFAAKNLYRFVRPGATRIGATSPDPNVRVVAFTNDATKRMTVFGIATGGKRTITLALPVKGRIPKTWDIHLTTRSLDCKRVQQVKTMNGVVRVDLPEDAVFTIDGAY
jgi:O-glycosyl hydrolase